jgi:hypothetical protein
LLASLVLTLVQSALIALAPINSLAGFGLVMGAFLLLYLLAPFFAHYRLRRTAAPEDWWLGMRIALTCACLVTISTGAVWVLDSHSQPSDTVGGFYDLRLAADRIGSLLGFLLLNGLGLALALLGSWLGRHSAARQARRQEEPAR